MILSANFHEFAHGLAALKLGDTTAKDSGRLTLNPLAHIDPVGTILLPLMLLFSNSRFVFGWAKPVPYNPHNLRDRRYGSLKVALAGPATNLAIAVFLGLLLRFSGAFGFISPVFLTFLATVVYINVLWALFNLTPVPPLDGSKIIMDVFPRARFSLEKLGFGGIFIAFAFAWFVLPPIADFVFRIIVGSAI